MISKTHSSWGNSWAEYIGQGTFQEHLRSQHLTTLFKMDISLRKLLKIIFTRIRRDALLILRKGNICFLKEVLILERTHHVGTLKAPYCSSVAGMALHGSGYLIKRCLFPLKFTPEIQSKSLSCFIRMTSLPSWAMGITSIFLGRRIQTHKPMKRNGREIPMK